MLWLDGVYENTTARPQRKPRLRRARAPTSAQLTELAGTIAHRVCRHLTRRGWLKGEEDSVFLSDNAGSADGMYGLRMSSITYRIATGKNAGRTVITLQTLPVDAGPRQGGAGQVGGFSLHAGVAAEAHERHKLEKLCRYITRPAISEKRLSMSPQGTALSAQDPVAKWHHACRMGCGGLHRQAGGAGAATPRASHPVSRHLCPERCPARAVDAIGARQAACDRCSAG